MSEDRVLSHLDLLKRGLDAPGPALPLTAERERALLDAALAEHAPVVARVPVWRFALAVGVVALSAAAGVGVLRWFGAPGGDVKQTRVPAAPAAAAPVSSEVARAAAAPVLGVAPAEQAAPAKPATALASPRSSGSAESLEATKEGDLLKQANDLRRSGDAAGAEKLYRLVMQRYPQTSSAYVAMSSVASLIMNRDPAGAVQVYRAARQAHPNGALDLEIRQGLARAHRKLGQTAAERQELEALIARYPRTEASERAKARLAEL